MPRPSSFSPSLPRVVPTALALLACAYAACSAPSPQDEIPVEAPTSVSPPDGTDPELARLFARTDMLLLGETHGTWEAPAFALKATLAAVSTGAPTILGLEIPHDEQAAIDTYLSSEGRPGDRELVLDGSFWRINAIDGRGSEAMLELIDDARQLALQGRRLSLLCFDWTPGDGPMEARDEIMARRVLDHREVNPGAKYVLLVGSYHAGTEPVEVPDGAAFRPMGHFLAAEDPGLVALLLRHAGGEAWCILDEPGVHRLPGSGDSGAQGVELFAQPDARGFAGAFDVGEITASHPARPDAGEPTLTWPWSPRREGE